MMKKLFALLLMTVSTTSCSETILEDASLLEKDSKHMEMLITNSFNGYENYAVAYGFKDIEITPGVYSEERVIFLLDLDYVNYSIVCNESLSAIIVVDSSGFPTRIATQNLNILLSKTDDKHFSCAIYDSKIDDWEILNNQVIDYGSTETKASTRAESVGGYMEFGVDDVFKYINLAHGLTTGIQAAQKMDEIGVLSTNLGIFGSLLANDEISTLVGLATVSNWVGASSTILGYLANKLDDLVVDLLGKVKLTIEGVDTNIDALCNVSFSVDGLNEKGLANSEISMEIDSPNGYFNYANLESSNHSGHLTWNGLTTGRYTIDFCVKSTICKALQYHALHSFCYIGLDSENYWIAPNPKYKSRDFENNGVDFQIEVYLKGDETQELNEWIKKGAEFGCCIYDEHTSDMKYYKADKFSQIFEYTPIMINLCLGREYFKPDFTNYQATATGLHLGTYAKIDGKFYEQELRPIDGLIYKRQPALTIEFKETSRGSLTSEEWDSYVSYDIEYVANGSLFINEIFMTQGDHWIDAGSSSIILSYFEDEKKYSRTNVIRYNSGGSSSAPLYFYAQLSNGETYQFPQQLIFEGGSLRKGNETRGITNENTTNNQYAPPMMQIIE